MFKLAVFCIFLLGLSALLHHRAHAEPMIPQCSNYSVVYPCWYTSQYDSTFCPDGMHAITDDCMLPRANSPTVKFEAPKNKVLVVIVPGLTWDECLAMKKWAPIAATAVCTDH